MTATEFRTVDVDVSTIKTEGNVLKGHAAVFNVTSEDLGGYVERLAPGCFTGCLGDDVRLLVDHKPPPLARTKAGTLRLTEDDTGLAFEADLPDTSYARDLKTSLARGDWDGMSFSFTVGDEIWEDGVRVVQRVSSLRDICVATFPAYPETSVQLRTKEPMNENTTGTSTTSTSSGTSGFTVEDRASNNTAPGLAAAFRRRGFPTETASIPWGEFRTASFTGIQGTIDDLSPVSQVGVPLGSDVRYAYPAFGSVSVDAGDTSVQVLRQVSRTLPNAEDVIRNIDATTPKPEVDTTAEIVAVPIRQVAAVEANVPNIILEQPAIETLIQTDLRLALNEALDKLLLDAVADSDNHPQASDPLLVAIRKAITIVQASGYAPDTLVLTPEDAEELDTLVAETATEHYVFGPATAAPRQIFSLNTRISKTAAAPVVVDASAFGRMYVSPIQLARFEENAGSTNTSTVRLEGHAAFGVERQAAALRIAAA